jgi:hypothetical protein
MPRTRAGKLIKGNSSSSSTTNISSHHQLYEATHVLLRESSTQKLISTELKLLSSATKAKPLVCGRNISFRDGTGRGQKQGEIILVGKLFMSISLLFLLSIFYLVRYIQRNCNRNE